MEQKISKGAQMSAARARVRAVRSLKGHVQERIDDCNAKAKDLREGEKTFVELCGVRGARETYMAIRAMLETKLQEEEMALAQLGETHKVELTS